MAFRSKNVKKKKYVIALSEREMQALSDYAIEMDVTRPLALRSIVKTYLKEYEKRSITHVPDNQLSLFDSIQLDIFNNTTDQ